MNNQGSDRDRQDENTNKTQWTQNSVTEIITNDQLGQNLHLQKHLTRCCKHKKIIGGGDQTKKTSQYELFNTIVYRKFQEIPQRLENQRPEHSVQDLQVGRPGPEH